MTADLIVAGSEYEAGKVEVSHVFFAADDAPKNGAKIKAGDFIEVPSLKTHGRMVYDWDYRHSANSNYWLPTNQLVLFLEYDDKGVLKPLYDSGICSQGVLWLTEEQTLAYRMKLDRDDPNAYELTPSYRDKGSGWEKFHGLVERDLKQRHLWEDIKAIERPERRAFAMTCLFLKATAPAETGTVGRQRFEGIDFMTAFEETGAAGISGIAEALNHAGPDEVLDELTGILDGLASDLPEKDASKALSPLVDPLVKRLESLDQCPPYHELYVLKLAADPKSVEAIRPFVKSDNVYIAGRAASALAVLGDQESFDAIAKRLENAKALGPNSPNGELARALFKLDPQKAKPIIEKVAKVPGNEDLIERVGL